LKEIKQHNVEVIFTFRPKQKHHKLLLLHIERHHAFLESTSSKGFCEEFNAKFQKGDTHEAKEFFPQDMQQLAFQPTLPFCSQELNQDQARKWESRNTTVWTKQAFCIVLESSRRRLLYRKTGRSIIHSC